ncbi:hypothetical protein [Phytoactinopolyspora mesophila]|uniref:hypothetical protein n=1 Tax=Phytoactinopolyspora mesophila TaxID=2650750 RepID=UPI0031B5D1BD
MYVLTADQRHSRRGRDLVEDALSMLKDLVDEPMLGFERTAGDEFQGVLRDAVQAVEVALTLVRQGSWSVGIGLGPADEPLPESTRAARGPAFVHARRALDISKRRPQRIAVAGPDDATARDADVLLTLLAALISRRTPAGWEAIDLMESGHSLADAAERLHITRQAVGQRLAVALWQQEKDVRPLAARLLEESDWMPGTRSDTGAGSQRGRTTQKPSPGAGEAR